ncbi:4-hydroxy-2-oxoheptanedioate aldolase [Rhizobiaceae bacterium n13]|uniref:4-hydroxy-2-oxoheptanedioate aldolase n=1 Tax=Ferirhizobium litorale TaxID=2927786 RepID=A0AAE3QKL3_9HYPH|nr:4-hydroxy-2-oxoheptanedioate aldolase [Fererhizobium litorale]MDI7864555.1 4-hydroxy-2-oxoheptanedioate aldolase [Fererhizobium litorale]MDI7924904.1 4-hydroxy-2-oxoheptanedioate aldolase [Fererhizobium litorale]
MPAPTNNFKAAIARGEKQIGLWLALASAYSAEIAGSAGFDWLLIDGEHAPNDLPLISAQIAALNASPSHPVVRVPIGETWIIKQVLDAGAQTILVPMVETAEHAQQLVRAMKYPPEGMRGVGAMLARASNFGRITDYLTTANDEVCLLLQAESRAAIDALDEIAAVDGVDGIFIGPSDLAADMGFLGRPTAPEVQSVIEDGLKRIIKSGKAAGILTGDPSLAQRYLELGASFVAVGTDVTLFTQATATLAARFKDRPEAPPAGY